MKKLFTTISLIALVASARAQLGFQGTTIGGSSVNPTGDGSALTGLPIQSTNIYYVSAMYGNDSTARIGDSQHPWFTLWNVDSSTNPIGALSLAQSGSTVVLLSTNHCAFFPVNINVTVLGNGYQVYRDYRFGNGNSITWTNFSAAVPNNTPMIIPSDNDRIYDIRFYQILTNSAGNSSGVFFGSKIDEQDLPSAYGTNYQQIATWFNFVNGSSIDITNFGWYPLMGITNHGSVNVSFRNDTFQDDSIDLFYFHTPSMQFYTTNQTTSLTTTNPININLYGGIDWKFDNCSFQSFADNMVLVGPGLNIKMVNCKSTASFVYTNYTGNASGFSIKNGASIQFVNFTFDGSTYPSNRIFLFNPAYYSSAGAFDNTNAPITFSGLLYNMPAGSTIVFTSLAGGTTNSLVGTIKDLNSGLVTWYGLPVNQNGAGLTNTAQNITTYTNFLFLSLFTNVSTRNELVSVNARCNPTTTGNAKFALVTSPTGSTYTTNAIGGLEADTIFTTGPHSWENITAQIPPGGIWKVVDITGEGFVTITNSYYQTLQ